MAETDPLYIFYYKHEPNFGDAANIELCQAISGRSVKLAETAPATIVMGSILDHAKDPFVVWGTGVLEESLRLECTPAKVLAVRGPMTRKWLLDQKVDCPKVYGDPGVLFERFFKFPFQEKYRLGIVPHYKDQSASCLVNLPEDVLPINVLQDPSTVLKEINQCAVIVSSSLHGLIAADSYGIPSLWVEFSDEILGKGFKFRDYFASCGDENRECLDLREASLGEFPIHEAVRAARQFSSKHLVKPLLEACPFFEE